MNAPQESIAPSVCFPVLVLLHLVLFPAAGESEPVTETLSSWATAIGRFCVFTGWKLREKYSKVADGRLRDLRQQK